MYSKDNFTTAFIDGVEIHIFILCIIFNFFIAAFVFSFLVVVFFNYSF